MQAELYIVVLGASALMATACASSGPDGGATADSRDTLEDATSFSTQLELCDAEGFWRVDYEPQADADAASTRAKLTDVLQLQPYGVRIDSYEAALCATEAQVNASWAEDNSCTLVVHRTTGPCGFDAAYSSLELVLTFGEVDAAVGAAAYGWAPSEGELPSVEYIATAQRLHADVVCDTEAGHSDELPVFGDPDFVGHGMEFAGEVVVEEIVAEEATVWVVARTLDSSNRIRIPLSSDHPAPPVVDDELWLDGESTSGHIPEGSYVLRTSLEGSLVSAGFSGGVGLLDRTGPWQRAGLSLEHEASCVPAWQPFGSGALVTLFEVNVELPNGSSASATPGESSSVEDAILGNLQLQVRYAERYEQAQSSDGPSSRINLVLQPAGDE